MSCDYSENILVQESAGHLLERELGWQVAFAYNTEQLGKDGTFGRTSCHEILLTRYFRQALQRLNPWLTSAQLDEAQKKMEQHLSTASLIQINEEKYALIRDGIPVTVKRPGGRTEEKKVAVIDFQHPENNHFLAIKELKIHGDQVQNYYMLYLILGLSVTLLVILIMKFLFGRRRKSDGSGRTDHSSKEGKK